MKESEAVSGQRAPVAGHSRAAILRELSKNWWVSLRVSLRKDTAVPRILATRERGAASGIGVVDVRELSLTRLECEELSLDRAMKPA